VKHINSNETMNDMFENIKVDTIKNSLDLRKENFLLWIKKNPQVWEEFAKLSLEAIKSGRKQYSAWLVAAVIRYRYDIKSSDGEFKISNEKIAWLARLFHEKYPQYKNFYVTRPMKDSL
tara:strand:+ start:171 stop:527 length:357 start_codon:yes stop_codon:yes gene_type:complete